MKKQFKAAAWALSVLIMSAAYLAAVYYTDRLQECEHFALVLMEQKSLDAAQARRMQKEEKEQENPWEFAAWSQKNEVTVENAAFGRSRTVSQVTVCCRPDMVFRAGARLDAGDMQGCLIDEHTALELFGGTDIAGETIEIDGAEKTVRGILYDAEDTVFCAAGNDGQELTHLLISMKTGGSLESVRQEFMARYGLQGQFVRLDILSRTAGLFCLRTHLSPDMIPTRWSDFDFWKTWWKKEREDVLRLLLTEKEKPMQRYIEDFYRAAGCGILCWAAAAAALAGMLRFMRRIR